MTAPVPGPTAEGAADARDARPTRAERRGHRIDWATFTKVSENEGMLFDTLLDVEFGRDRDE